MNVWLRAARPKTLAASSSPVLIGLAVASTVTDIKWLLAAVCIVFAVLMQIAANYANDLIDFMRGGDGPGRIGPDRVMVDGEISIKKMKVAVGIVIAIALGIGSIALYYSGMPLLLLGAACAIGAYFYTPLAYHGWGDVLVFLFFGIVPVSGTYYIQTGAFPSHDAILAGAVIGLIIDRLLVVNNYRDREQDKNNGKRTTVVIFGGKFGLILYLILGLAACWLSLIFAINGHIYAALLPQLYLPYHIFHWLRLSRADRSPNKIEEYNICLTSAGQGILIYAALLSIGFIL